MRRRSWSATINRYAAQQAALARAQARFEREQAKQEKNAYISSRAAEADLQNAIHADDMAALRSLLTSAIKAKRDVKFKALYRSVDEAELDSSLSLPPEPSMQEFAPKPLGFFGKLSSSKVAKHKEASTQSKAAYAKAVTERTFKVKKRDEALRKLTEEVQAHNRAVDSLAADVRNGEPGALVTYAELLLTQSEYPDGFPKSAKAGLVPESKQIVVEYELPLLDDVVPAVEQYRYVKSSDQITSKRRSERERRADYLGCVAQVAIRTLHEIFTAEGLRSVDVAVFNGYVNTIDKATGHKIAPHLVSVRATREDFASLDLRNIDPAACLKRLSAAVSPSPAEMQAVKPIVDFNMVDPRFIEEQDVLSTLDARPNLMELSPSEFESLVTNLFQKMGLETKLTQASRDGGVDCVAWDKRPILGGKVVIQAKRYKHTVGVSAVRDLFGTVHNEGASKGILVTTSGFGAASMEFANGKPLELIAGGGLLYLLKEHAGIDAKIEVPENWVDPANAETT